MPEPQHPIAAEKPDTSARDKLVIGLLLCAAFTVILNETIMSVALPALMTDLSVDATTVQWVSTGFMLTMAIVIPITGFIQQRFTTRQVFIGAMSTFCLGTLIAGVAPGFAMLLLGRVVQACGTAVMMPLLMTTILTLIPMNRRGRVMGTVSIVMSVAPALGPTLSGLILQFLSWRWMFFLVLPIAVGMTALGALRMQNISEPRRVPLDVPSVILAAAGFGGLVYALNQMGGEGGEGGSGGHEVMIVSLVVCALGLVGFVTRQLRLQKVDAPLLDLRTLKHRNYTLGIGMLMIAFGGLLGIALLWPMYLLQVHGLNSVTTGLLLLPGGLAMGLLGPAVGRLYDRFGVRPLTVPAAIVMVLMILAMSTADQVTPLPFLLAYHVLMSMSLAFVFTPIFTNSLNALPPNLYPHGSALLGTLQQVGGAAGTALLVTVMANRSAVLAAEGAGPVDALHGGLQMAFWTAAALCSGVAVLGLFTTKQGGSAQH